MNRNLVNVTYFIRYSILNRKPQLTPPEQDRETGHLFRTDLVFPLGLWP